MPSKIDVDLLLVALFDLPAGVRVKDLSIVGGGQFNNDAAVILTNDGDRYGTPSNGRGELGRRLNQPDDGVDTETPLLHGESISLTDEECSPDAVQVEAARRALSPPDTRPSNSTFTSFRPNTALLPVRLPLIKMSNEYASRERSTSLSLGIGSRHRPAMPSVSKKFPDEFVTCGEERNLSLELRTQQPATENKSPEKQVSPKKKRRSAAVRSLKKLIGRKSKSASAALTMSSPFDEVDLLIGSPTPSFYVSDNEQSPQNFIDESLLFDRLSSLKSKIGTIRSTIHSLEGDLLATRKELARAHENLYLATTETADLQRATRDADIGLVRLMQSQGGMSELPAVRLSPLHFYGADMSARSSSRSSSSDCLHYFTPTSSTRSGDDDDSDYCFTPLSRASSYESLSSASENDCFSTPIFDEATNWKSVGDKDKTPLTRNDKPQHRRRFRSKSIANVSIYLTCGIDSNKNLNSIDTPCAVTSTQDEMPTPNFNRKVKQKTNREQIGWKVTLFRQPSFIRVHDLALTDNNTALLPLHDTDPSDVINALFKKGVEFAMDESDRWSPESTTRKILSKRAKKFVNGEIDGPMEQWPNAVCGDEVLLWTSKCPHDEHGSEYPLVKARGLIPTSAQSLLELLMDSSKVKVYNKMSLGRIDEHCFAEGIDKLTAGIQGEAKIVRSKSQPPLIRKPVELRLLLHARRLQAESGQGAKYLTIGRSVWETEQGTTGAHDTSATRGEMLLSVNLIRDLPIRANRWCEITTITHGVSAGIPISIGKRIGLIAAVKYIRDIRAVFEKPEI